MVSMVEQKAEIQKGWRVIKNTTLFENYGAAHSQTRKSPLRSSNISIRLTLHA